MSDRPAFTLTIDQNKYLSLDGREVHAILTVSSTGGVTTQAVPAEAAEVIIVDTSGSMSGAKIREARQAAATAVQTLRDGVHFAVVSGTGSAKVVYPSGSTPSLVQANPATRAEAAKAVERLLSYGGTAMGEWLKLAGHLLSTRPHAIKHALLMTDGQNNERADVFDSVLSAWSGTFVCDCLGIGADWQPAELRKVAEAMLGTFDYVRDQGDLPEYFRRLTQASMNKTMADLSLRVWVPQAARLMFVKQVDPVLLDLTGKRADVNPLTGDYPTGSWGPEERKYHICVEVPPGQVGQEIRAGWVKLVHPDTQDVLASGNVLAQWTDDLALSTQINGNVAHYTGQAELHDLIQDGLSARAMGDIETATARLAKARDLAGASGREDTAKLLDRVVEVDPATGTARLHKNVDKEDTLELDTGSVRTSRLRREGI
ncbi:VWA domain-containing protein [Nonomuraea sp. KC401]|uniref:vWA domain-containing protein n=1 Tax=unclassified Nonomuraea TaxID=2593643 RepID=UPI0010FF5D23|nr:MULTISPECIES: VWA domain-containing protein [unclassified Nonomuraea]NBE99181.1 VWA domain-containing protein [Nonomuraea sp. K271]TLF57694.1 VWA domain-containing protein [Nonomuraea sp. KC401]